MNQQIREKLLRRLLAQADIREEPITFKHCKLLAERVDCDPNSMARLFGISNFKPTQCMKPEIEQKLAYFLGYSDYEYLEESLMHEVVWEEFRRYCEERSKYPAERR